MSYPARAEGFVNSIRVSRKAGSLWRIMRGVGGVRKSEHHSCSAKGLGLGLLCWGFKGVQQEIPSEEASTLQIGSEAFPTEQCTRPQLHPCHKLLTKMGIKTVPQPPYSPDVGPCDFCLFPKLRGCRYETIEKMEKGCDEGNWHAHTRWLRWGLPEVVGMVQQVHCSRRILLRRGMEFYMCTMNKSAHTKKVWKLIKCSS